MTDCSTANRPHGASSAHVAGTAADGDCKSQLAVCAEPGCGDGGVRSCGRSQDERQGETSVRETFLKATVTRTHRRARHGSVIFLATLLLAAAANATENGGSVYPVGVETVKPGLTPPPNGSVIFEFTAFYSANQTNNSAGLSAAPEFKPVSYTHLDVYKRQTKRCAWKCWTT